MTAQGGALGSAWLRAPLQTRRAIFLMCYGPEFAGRMLDQWGYLNRVEIDFSRPGKPTDNGNNRVVQWPPASGMSERLVVPIAGRCRRAHRGLEVPL